MGSQELGMTEWLSTGTNVYTMCPSHRRCLKVKWKSFSCVCLFATPRTIQSMEFSSQNIGVGGHSLLRGFFPNQGSNPGLPPCRWILYRHYLYILCVCHIEDAYEWNKWIFVLYETKNLNYWAVNYLLSTFKNHHLLLKHAQTQTHTYKQKA